MSSCPAIALYQPSIPPNTGNIGRLCVGFGVELYLIKPLGFNLRESQLKRAGLDYWTHLKYIVYDDFLHFHNSQKGRKIIVLSKYSKKSIYDHHFSLNTILLMGNEIHGIPETITEQYQLQKIAIPILGPIRSYNLANATAIALSESYRQLKWNNNGKTE